MSTEATKSRPVNLRLSDSDRASPYRAEQLLREHAALVVPSDLFNELLAALDEPCRELPDHLTVSFEHLFDIVEFR